MHEDFTILCVIFQNYRRSRQKAAARTGTTNSTSKIDSVARILFPVSFGLFDFAYWYSYFQAQKPFDWEDHMLTGKFLSFIGRIMRKIESTKKLRRITQNWLIRYRSQGEAVFFIVNIFFREYLELIGRSFDVLSAKIKVSATTQRRIFQNFNVAKMPKNVSITLHAWFICSSWNFGLWLFSTVCS